MKRALIIFLENEIVHGKPHKPHSVQRSEFGSPFLSLALLWVRIQSIHTRPTVSQF